MNREEQIKLELSILLDEYKALKSEIVSTLGSARQVVNLTLAAIGVLIAGSKYVVESGFVIIFLIAPLFFYVLAWTQLRYTFLVLDMGLYLRDDLTRHIREALRKLSEESMRDFSYIMQWEEAGKGPTRRHKGIRALLFLPIAGGSFGVPLFAAVLSTLAFFALMDSRHELGILEIGLILFNVVALIHSAAWGWIAERRR